MKTTTTTEITWLPNGCPESFNIHHLIPHEYDCNKFYICDFGQKVERSCALGTYFDPSLQICNWPFAVNCTSSSTPGPPATTQEATSTTSTTTTTLPPPTLPPQTTTTTQEVP
ncbi:jg2557, partial [Pararge aegeria aegeria]